jgi:hypothetical protein
MPMVEEPIKIEQFPQVTEHVKTLHFKANCMDFLK